MEAGARSAQDTMQHRKRWRRDGGKENRGDNNDDEVINTLCDEGKRKALFKECATGKRNATREAVTKLSREQII